jgi:hypothetical protein
MNNWSEAQKIHREIVRSNPDTGPHGSHCWMNQYSNGCKYGDAATCPARPKIWPHRTYDEDGRIVLVTEDGGLIDEDTFEGMSDEILIQTLEMRGYTVTKNG